MKILENLDIVVFSARYRQGRAEEIVFPPVPAYRKARDWRSGDRVVGLAQGMFARADPRRRSFAIIMFQCPGVLIREFLIYPPQTGIDVRLRQRTALPFPFREIMRVIFHGLTLPTSGTPVIQLMRPIAERT
jgi:hypothetical protein